MKRIFVTIMIVCIGWVLAAAQTTETATNGKPAYRANRNIYRMPEIGFQALTSDGNQQGGYTRRTKAAHQLATFNETSSVKIILANDYNRGQQRLVRAKLSLSSGGYCDEDCRKMIHSTLQKQQVQVSAAKMAIEDLRSAGKSHDADGINIKLAGNTWLNIDLGLSNIATDSATDIASGYFSPGEDADLNIGLVFGLR